MVVAGLELERGAAVGLAAVDVRDDAVGLDVDSAERVDELREVAERDVDDVVDVDAEVLLDHVDGQARAADRVGGVDLVGSEARGVDHQVARDRELRRLPAARADEHDRVRPLRAADVGARLGEAGNAAVGAEDEDRGGLDQWEATARQRVLGRVAHGFRVDLGRDQKERERQQDPAHNGAQDPLEDAAAGDRTRRHMRARQLEAPAAMHRVLRLRTRLKGDVRSLVAQLLQAVLDAFFASLQKPWSRAVDPVVGLVGHCARP